MTTIKITEKERQLILDGLQTAAARLHDFANEYKKHGDAPNTIDCINEANKYYALANKIHQETAK